MSVILNRRGALAFGLSAATTACATSRKGPEVILCDGGSFWGRAQRRAFYKPFEEETGIRVRTVPFVMPGKLRTSIEQGRPVIDVADISGAELPRFERDGLLAPVDLRGFDPQDIAALGPRKPRKHALPSFYASTVLAYRQELFPGREPAGWAAMWDTARHPGERMLGSGLMGQMAATFEIALLADGVSPERLYPLDWDRAIRALRRLRPSVARYWLSSGDALQMLNEQNVVIGNIWNGPVDTPEARDAGSLYTWNQGILQGGYWAIPRGAPNHANALRFMAFALRPDRQAHFASLIGYSPANQRAFVLLPPGRTAHLPTAPQNLTRQIMQDDEWWAKEDRPGITNVALSVKLWETEVVGK
ncbi:extracellular solute-binding protein [Novosphingobium sp. fls2-241-R2A-195]|uniref:extracellular solute-binding protein n=1 Tax=Novosphingobium sp. fls2-241-R2A-195 TaxID=3040296 RepID=UPI002550582E|nr:extracellular solute-binding protein [Novosphingobium sp. fls2-241-R2A-195]